MCLGNYIGYQFFHLQFPTSTWVADMTLANAVVAVSYVVSGLIVGLYEAETLRHRSRIVVRSLLTVALAIAIAYVLMHTLMYEIYSRRIAIISPLTFIALSVGARLLTYRVLRNLKHPIIEVDCPPRSESSIHGSIFFEKQDLRVNPAKDLLDGGPVIRSNQPHLIDIEGRKHLRPEQRTQFDRQRLWVFCNLIIQDTLRTGLNRVHQGDCDHEDRDGEHVQECRQAGP